MEFHPIPKYRNMGVIEALKIAQVHHSLDEEKKPTVTLIFEDDRFGPYILKPELLPRCPRFEPGAYFVRLHDGALASYSAKYLEKDYQLATEITPELLSNLRAVVTKDLISDDEIGHLNQMVLDELHAENQGVIGGPDVIHMQYPGRLAEAVTEMVLNKLAAMA